MNYFVGKENDKLNIIVCMKQVPDTNEVKIDPETNTLMRAGVPSIMNPFDTFALEMALQLKEKTNGTVTAVTMGPDQAKDILKQAYAVGADKMVLVTDRKFGGSDTLATSYTLACTVSKLGDYDVIFCGKQAIDGDTAQVGPELAEHLGVPQITYGVAVDYVDGEMRIKRENDDVYEIMTTMLPAVVTFTKTDIELRNPNIKRRMEANKKEIEVIAAADLEGIDETRLGLKGSPTRVRKVFAPPVRKAGAKIEGYDAEESAKIAVKTIIEKKAL